MSTTDPSAPADAPESPEPLTSPGEPTALQQLSELGRYLDHTLLPTLNELPAVVAALIYGPAIRGYVAELRQQGHADVEIASAVSHVVSPPVPGATANVIQGVDPAQHSALQEEVAELRGLVESLQAERQGLPAAPPATTSGAAPNTRQLSPQEEELAALRAEVQSLQIQAAANQHPTAASEAAPSEEAADPAPEPPPA